jgi:hypothetical protein
LLGKRERKRSLGRPGARWEDNVIIDLKNIGYGNIDGIQEG